MNILSKQEHERRLEVYYKAVEAGASFKDFINMSGLSYDAAYRWCRINNLVIGKVGTRSPLNISDDYFIQIYSENEDPKAIIEKLGIDKSAYYYRCHRLGLMPKKYPTCKGNYLKCKPKNEYTEELMFFERQLIKHSKDGTVSVSRLMKEINKMNSRGGMVNGQS